VIGLKALPCAASTLLRIPIDGPRCPSVPLCRPAIGAKLPFVSLILHIANMTHLQLPVASSYSRSQDQSHRTCLHSPGRRIKKAGCMYRPESSRTGRNPQRKTTNTHIHHASSSRPRPIKTQATPTDPLSRKAKQSDKVPDFQRSA
jgi:hypothetical protein